MNESSEVILKNTKDGVKKGSKQAKRMKELKRLEKIVFGDLTSVLGGNKRKKLKKKRKPDFSNKESGNTTGGNSDGPTAKRPAWEDDDDEESIQSALEQQRRPFIEYAGNPSDKYTNMLKKKFESVMGTPKWAQLKREKDSDDDDDDSEIDEDDKKLLQSCGNFVEKTKTLTKGTIPYNLVQALNTTTECEGPVITSVEFHPTSTIGLVGGTSGIVSLFEVDGKVNSKLHSVKFSNFRVNCAKFSHDGNQFITGSCFNKDFYCYDLIAGKSHKIELHAATELTNMKKFEVSPDGRFIAACGRFGNIMLLSAKSKEWIDTLKANTHVESVCFSSDGESLYSHGDDGYVYVWDLNSRRCKHKFYDDGCLKGTCISISPNSKLVACGSNSGVVNVYNTDTILKTERPSPLTIFLNLRTAISSLQFNHSSELLAMASDNRELSLRMAHFPSMTVYSNFPSNHVSHGLTQCVAFSPHSGYFATGSNIKKALLYRLTHFGSY